VPEHPDKLGRPTPGRGGDRAGGVRAGRAARPGTGQRVAIEGLGGFSDDQAYRAMEGLLAALEEIAAEVVSAVAHLPNLDLDIVFVDKLIDVVGLYLNLPEQAVVLCMDEKSQALDRTQPSLPMKKGRADTMTHDYKRHGTTTLFAALNVLTGVVIGRCLPRHRNIEFLRIIDREVPKGLQIHMICDNYGTHKHPNVKAWLAKRPRFHLHFTPTSSSWLNLVERWFRDLTDKAIRRGVFHSVNDLIAAIEDYLKANNDNPKSFVWTATAEQILIKVARGRVGRLSDGWIFTPSGDWDSGNPAQGRLRGEVPGVPGSFPRSPPPNRTCPVKGYAEFGIDENMPGPGLCRACVRCCWLGRL
jgi:transposase